MEWATVHIVHYSTLLYSILRFDYCGELRQSLSNMGILTIKNGNRNVHELKLDSSKRSDYDQYV